MAIHKFWRLTGFLTDSNVLELSQAQLYDNGTLIAQAPTFTIAPITGTAFPDTLRWENFSASGFALVWNLTTPVESPNLRLGAGTNETTFPKQFYFQYSDDGLFWSTNNSPGNVLFPGVGLLTTQPVAGAPFTGVTAKYIRLFCLAANGGSYYRVGEVEVSKASGGPNLCVGGTAYGDNNVYPPERAFDGNYSGVDPNAWAGNPGSPRILQYTFLDPVEIGFVRVYNGGATYQTLMDYDIETSDDGAVWVKRAQVRGQAPDPSLIAETAIGTPSGATDPNFANVSLLLHGDGSNGSTTFTDSSPTPKTVTTFAATVSTTQSKFGGASILLNSSSYLTTPANAAYDFGAGDFTVEAWAYITGPLNDHRPIVCCDNIAGVRGWLLLADKDLGGKFSFSGFIGGSPVTVTSTSPATLNTWVHVAVARSGGSLQLFVDGILNATTAITGSIQNAAQPLCVGALWLSGAVSANAGRFIGNLEEIRITKGIARYTANFTPPTVAFPNTTGAASVFIPINTIRQALRWRALPPPNSTIVGSVMQEFNLKLDLTREAFLDAYHGGMGKISGIVSEKSTVNKPLSREVLLIDEDTNIVIRKTWSHPITGVYEFLGIKETKRYTVLSYDYTQSYRAVVTDNRTPDIMLGALL